ncbi:MAG: DUF2779 domain-containing protein [Betaproteobacteria bacterium]|nr:DUF2779 domain-containing protein [Betaproteobacteria bacterium]
MRTLSKSKIMAFRQCPRRVWLEVHRPDLKEDSAATQASYDTGHTVGDLARRLYDRGGDGELIDIDKLGFPAVFDATAEALASRHPIFEAAFTTGDALALADVLLPVGQRQWRMVEVKSSTSVKDAQREDLAIQAHIATKAGVNLKSMALAHIDSSWVYPGDEDYSGLLVEADLTDETKERVGEVQGWIDAAQAIVAGSDMPAIKTGPQCDSPYACGFFEHCASLEPVVEMPIQWLPRFRAQPWIEQGVIDLRNVPLEELNDVQRRVRECTVQGRVHFDAEGAKADLAAHELPAYFLDFETIQFGVPIWAGTRPYQQIPFQYSVHRLDARGHLEHGEFLDLSGRDPSRAFAEQLIADCGDAGPVFVYNAAFEKSRMAELAGRFTDLKEGLEAIIARVIDLLPIARNRYYHPSQKGSWSIKAVLPAVVPELSYEALDGVRNGGDAQEAFLEAIHPQTSAEQRETLRTQLLAYCALDTYAMVRLWQVFAGRTNWRL